VEGRKDKPEEAKGGPTGIRVGGERIKEGKTEKGAERR